MISSEIEQDLLGRLFTGSIGEYFWSKSGQSLLSKPSSKPIWKKFPKIQDCLWKPKKGIFFKKLVEKPASGSICFLITQKIQNYLNKFGITSENPDFWLFLRWVRVYWGNSEFFEISRVCWGMSVLATFLSTVIHLKKLTE